MVNVLALVEHPLGRPVPLILMMAPIMNPRVFDGSAWLRKLAVYAFMVAIFGFGAIAQAVIDIPWVLGFQIVCSAGLGLALQEFLRQRVDKPGGNGESASD